MNKSYNLNCLISGLFLILLFFGFIKSNSYSEIKKLFGFIKSNYYSEIKKFPDFLSHSDDMVYYSIEDIESDFSNNLTNKKDYISLNGNIIKLLGIKDFYSDIGIHVSNNDYIVSKYPKTSTDYEYEQITSLYKFLNEKNIKMMYVNQPIKYIDDDYMLKEFGIKSYSNQNADLFLKRIDKEGIPYLDLRENIKSENINSFDLFYRTDHHWTTKAGLWATNHIAKAMNQQLGYNIDESLFDISNFNIKEWKNCWLGEQGRKIAETYIGLDDYTKIIPNFTTSYTFPSSDDQKTYGSFDDFINEEKYSFEKDVYKNSSWHYSYRAKNCINNNVQNGKILMLADSYAMVTEPFLSLGVNKIDYLILRSVSDSFSLRNYILENQYDTILICYAQFMIGAHDSPDSSNYKMFTFDK